LLAVGGPARLGPIALDWPGAARRLRRHHDRALDAGARERLDLSAPGAEGPGAVGALDGMGLAGWLTVARFADSPSRSSWVDALRDSAPAQYDVGLRFTGIRPGDRERLSAVLAAACT